MVGKIVQNIITWQGSTSIWIREASGLNIVVAIPTQLQQGQTLPLSIGDTITVTGIIMSERSPQGFWQVKPGHVYLGGSTYGAMSVEPSISIASAEDGAAISPSKDGRGGGGPFRYWPGPTAEEILASDSFQQRYNQVGAIGWALSHPDGSLIDLTAEVISGEWYDHVFGLREWFEPIPSGPRLYLYLDNPAVISGFDRDMITVDIVGATLTTLSNGQRALVRPQAVYAYTDQNGKFMLPLPWPKYLQPSTNGLRTNSLADSPSEDAWPWKLKIAP